MEKYENVEVVGQGSYGIVMKCRHKESGQLVAIKKFLEGEDDANVKKIALREIRMLKKLRHENLVNLIEVFRRRRRLYLVFEFVDHTVLGELEQNPNGLDEEKVRQHTWQVLRALDFCHSHNIIHRDIKPENILVSRLGVVKLCDFGFARLIGGADESYTDYVATRWYRAPELLVGDTKYGWEVDVWAVGCLVAEMLTGEPLFPGESDMDQIFYITTYLGPLIPKHQQMMAANPMFVGMKFNTDKEMSSAQKLSNFSVLATELIKLCLQLGPKDRPTCTQLLGHKYFTCDRFPDKFLSELKQKIQKEFRNKPSFRSLLKSNAISLRGTDTRNKPNFISRDTKDEPLKFRIKVSEIEFVPKSSAIEPTRLVTPKLIPIKIAPRNFKTQKPSTNDVIPPINNPITEDINHVQFALSQTTSKAPSPTGFKGGVRKTPVHRKKSSFLHPQTASNTLDDLVQGERSFLHDKGFRVKRKSKLSHVTSHITKDDFSLPDVPGATNSLPRRVPSNKKPFLTPVIPNLHSTSDTQPQDKSPSPPHSSFDSSLPLV